MSQDQPGPSGAIAVRPLNRCRMEASSDPVGEMIVALQSLGLLVARGPTITREEFEILSRTRFRSIATQPIPSEGLSSSVSASERIFDALASEAP